MIVIYTLPLVQHPDERLRLTEILDHPFMLGQPLQQHHRQLQNQHRDKLMRGIAPNHLVSLDSGHATQCTSSSNSNYTIFQGATRTGPLRATMRPRGLLPPPTASPLCSVSGSSNADTASTSSLHRRSRNNSLSSSQPSAFSESNQQQQNDGFTRRRARSVEERRRGGRVKEMRGEGRVHGGGEENGCLSQQLPYSSSHQPSTVSRKARDLNQQDQENLYIISAKRTVFHGENGPGMGRLPLQDNTNRQQWQQKQQATQHAGSTSSLISSKSPNKVANTRVKSSLVPPLNASRLKPMQQDTRSALVRGAIHLCIGIVSCQ